MMLKLIVPPLMIAAAVLVSAKTFANDMPQQAAAPVIVEPTMMTAGCVVPIYPPRAARNDEAGIVLLGFLVSANGTLEQAKIINSSGVPVLDEGALTPLSKCKFTPGTIDGKPATMWMGIHYSWLIDGGSQRMIVDMANNAKHGSISAYYSLHYMLTHEPTPDAGKADSVLRLGAEKGNASAQFTLGQQYAGTLPGVAVDLQKAQYWLSMAAASGHELAIQALGFLPPAQP
jgi:TonB family protein